MEAEFTGFGARDFRQRYHGSYGYYTTPETKKKILVNMAVITDRVAEFTDQKGNHYSANADTGVVFDFIPVAKRLFISEKQLMLIERRPARMWARGINTQNTSITNVATKQQLQLSFKRILDATTPEGYQKVIQENTQCIRRLSNIFGIINDTVYIYDNVIGVWDEKNTTIALTSNLFIQELQDLIKKLNKQWKVTSDGTT